MDAKDLRIGNIVHFSRPKDLIFDWKSGEFELTKQRFYTFLGSEVLWKYVKPIPLTEEWLLRAGLRKEGSRYYIGDEYWIQQDGDHWVMIDTEGWVEITSFDYVHEFQNAYKVILKKEVEFND